MSFPNDDFMSFMGYRNMVVEEKKDRRVPVRSS